MASAQRIRPPLLLRLILLAMVLAGTSPHSAAATLLPNSSSQADRLCLQGSLSEMQGDLGVARALYRKVLDEVDAPAVAAESLFRLGLEAGDDDAVEKAARWLMVKEPARPEVQVWLDRLYTGGRLGELDMALQALPDTVSIHLRVQRLLDPPMAGVRVDSLGRVQALESLLRHLLRQNADSWERWGVRSRLLWEQILLFSMRQDRLKEADGWLATCPMASQDAAAWLVRARMAALSEDLVALRRAVEVGRGLDSLEAFYPVMAGRLALEDKEPLLALEELRLARRLDPEDPGIISLMALAQEDAGLLDEAESSLRVLLVTTPEDEDVWTQLCSLLQGQGRNTEALSLYDRGRRELGDTATPNFMNNYAYALAQVGEGLNEALAMAEKAVQAEPDNAAYRDTIGWIYLQLNRMADAETQLERARDLMAGALDWEVLLHLGILRKRQGRVEEARALWQKALELLPADSQDSHGSVLRDLLSGLEP